jgi:hypothetical protein
MASRYEHLSIYKSTLEFCTYIEQIVKSFDKYNKYAIGLNMRDLSKRLLFSISRINARKDKRVSLEKFIFLCEDTKSLLNIANELKAFKSFKQFEFSIKLLVNILKQAQSWYNSFARVSK